MWCDVIYHPFPINFQYLKMWGIDSSEEFNLGLYMKLKLQLSSLLPPGVHTPGIWQLCLPRRGVGGEFDIRKLKQQWQLRKHHCLKMWSRAASNFIILIPSLSVHQMLAIALCTFDITNFRSLLWLRHWTWYLLRALYGESHVHQQIYVIFEDFYRQKKQNPYVVVNFLSQVIFVLLLFCGMLMYANEVETKEKWKLTEIKN